MFYFILFEVVGWSWLLKRVTKEILPGVVIDEKLTWEDHMNEIIVPKVRRGLCMLGELQPILTTYEIISLHQALVSLHFKYCRTIWRNCGAVLKK